jgi:quercetin dioxygenase-like cupin family protein
MKKLFLFVVCFLVFAIYGKNQQNSATTDTIKVILENNKIKVTEYSSTAGKDVCGKGKHTHPPHLSIFLTDAKVRLTTEDGKTQDFDIKAGTAFWSEAETHMVINNGNKPAKVYLVEVK